MEERKSFVKSCSRQVNWATDRRFKRRSENHQHNGNFQPMANRHAWVFKKREEPIGKVPLGRNEVCAELLDGLEAVLAVQRKDAELRRIIAIEAGQNIAQSSLLLRLKRTPQSFGL